MQIISDTACIAKGVNEITKDPNYFVNGSVVPNRGTNDEDQKIQPLK